MAALGIFLLSALPACYRSSARTKQHDLADVQRLTDSLSAWTARQTPVGAVALVIRNGKVLLHEAYGWSNVERQIPMDTTTLFRMGSNAKPVLGTGVLILVEEGKLCLDDKVSYFIPAFADVACDTLTVEHLLRHTSGYDRQQIWKDYNDMAKYRNIRAAVSVIAKYEPRKPVGTESYSSVNSALLTEIIRIVSGMPAEEFLQRRIFEPLRMTSSYLVEDPKAPWYPRLATTYSWSKKDGKATAVWDPLKDRPVAPFFRGGTGLTCTASDYARFLQVWVNKGELDGVRLLQEETVALALDNNGRYFGLHWGVPRSPEPGDGMPGAFGHRGRYGTSGVVYTRDKAIVVFLTQTYNQPMIREFHDVLAQTYLFRHPGPYELDMILPDLPYQLTSSELVGYAGNYTGRNAEGRPWSATITLEEGHLKSVITGKNEGWTERLVWMENNTFAPGSMKGDQPRGIHSEVRYRFHPDGSFSYMVSGEEKLSFSKKTAIQ